MQTYHEVAVDKRFKQSMRIEPGAIPTTDFDLDLFGHDNGSKRDDNFRLIFQLGAGYMMYLYVVGFSPNEPLHYFHTFWIKGAVAVEVEMVEYGAPSFVSAAFRSLPVIYKRLELRDSNGSRQQFTVDSCSFEAKSESALFLQMRWALNSLDDGKPADLLWNNKDGLVLQSNGQQKISHPVFREIT